MMVDFPQDVFCILGGIEEFFIVALGFQVVKSVCESFYEGSLGEQIGMGGVFL